MPNLGVARRKIFSTIDNPPGVGQIFFKERVSKHNIVTFVYIKLVVYYNKRSRKSRGIGDLKRNP